jgi:hypothetical protein
MISMSFMTKYWIIGLSLIFSICVGGITEAEMKLQIQSYLKKEFKSVEKQADDWIKEAGAIYFGVDNSNKEYTAQDSTLLYYSYLWKSKALFCLGYIDSSRQYQRQINKLKLTSYKQDFPQIPSFQFELNSLDDNNLKKYFQTRYLTLGKLNFEDDTTIVNSVNIPKACELRKEKGRIAENVKFFLNLPHENFLELEYDKQLKGLTSGMKDPQDFMKFESFNAVYNRCKILRKIEKQVRLEIDREIRAKEKGTKRNKKSKDSRIDIKFNHKYSNDSFVHEISFIPVPFTRLDGGNIKLTYDEFYRLLIDNRQLLTFTNFKEEDYADSPENFKKTLKILWNERDGWEWNLRDIKDTEKIIIYLAYSEEDQDYYIYKDKEGNMISNVGLSDSDSDAPEYDFIEMDGEDGRKLKYIAKFSSSFSDSSEFRKKLSDNKIPISYADENLKLLYIEYDLLNTSNKDIEKLVISLNDDYGYYRMEKKKKKLITALLLSTLTLTLINGLR